MSATEILGGTLSGLLCACMWPAVLPGGNNTIDSGRSVLVIRVFKTGVFSALGHDHKIEAPIKAGTVNLPPRPAVALDVDARKLRVLDTEVSASTRAKIQRTMEGPAVLDAERFPEISFRSMRVESIGTDHWTVHGDLTLHGQTRPVTANVALQAGHYRGSTTLKQREFGMTPMSIAGGTIKVKDEVKVEFDIVLSQ
jgi:hypothetical protein